MNNHKVIEYGIPNGKMIGSFGLDRLAEVISELIKHKNLISQCAEQGGKVTFDDFIPYHIVGSAVLHDNALVIYFEEFCDPNAKHEDAGKSILYIFNEEIVYVVTEVDPKVNTEYVINAEVNAELAQRAGNVTIIPPALKEAVTFKEKMSHFFTKKKRAQLQEQRTNALNRIYMSVNRLDSVTDIERR